MESYYSASTVLTHLLTDVFYQIERGEFDDPNRETYEFIRRSAEAQSKRELEQAKRETEQARAELEEMRKWLGEV